MDAYRVAVYLHIVLAVVLMGMGLFWLVMLAALRQRFSSGETDQWLLEARRARWPHVLVPRAMRLPLPWVTWILLVALVLSGVFIVALRGMPEGKLWQLKLVLVVVIVGVQIPLSHHPSARTIRAGFWLTLAVIAVSAIALRT